MSNTHCLLIATLLLLMTSSLVPNTKGGQNQNLDDRHIPITTDEVVSAKDANQKRKREEKTRRYHQRGELREDSQISEISNSESPFEFLEPLPTRLSDVVVSGEITSSSAFLTNDRTAIYSEFTIRISEVLKNLDASVCVGCELTAERKGGGIKFPSGHIQKYANSGEAMPRVGGRYIFFLKRFDSGPDFSLLKAYELNGNSIYPLDKFSADSAYRGSDAAMFLAILRNAIMESAPARKENEQ